MESRELGENCGVTSLLPTRKRVIMRYDSSCYPVSSSKVPGIHLVVPCLADPKMLLATAAYPGIPKAGLGLRVQGLGTLGYPNIQIPFWGVLIGIIFLGVYTGGPPIYRNQHGSL